MTQLEYLKSIPIYTEAGELTEQWALTKAYIRMSQSGTIQLNRYTNGKSLKMNRKHQYKALPTNHEGDAALINELHLKGLLKVHWAPDTINLMPSSPKKDWIAVMDSRDSEPPSAKNTKKTGKPFVAPPPPPPCATKSNPLYGLL
jgi:hypothetical protein